MGDPTTIALNLTFFGTLGLAFLMFLFLFLLVVVTLVIAGVGRLAALMLMALFGRLPKNETLPLVRLSGTPAEPAVPAAQDLSTHDGEAATPSPGQPARAGVLRAKTGALWTRLARRQRPVLAEDWAAAVAEADARAMARARATAPEISLSAGDLPVPGVPADTMIAVAPLVESALHQDQPARDVPRSFTKPPPPEPLSPLDTGSLMSLSGHTNVLKGRLPADRR